MAIERACAIDCTAMQIFVKNNMQWFARPLTREEISSFLEHRQRRQLLSIFAHANYLINLAATNPQGRFIQPQEVAAAVLWLCSEAAGSITGQAISLSGGETW